jgi:hypothetical protein
MKMSFSARAQAAGIALATFLAVPAQAATIIVNHDEWTLSDVGFANATTTGNFVANLVSEFGTNIHAYSNNFGFVQSALATAMGNAGATYSTGTGFAFTLANISAYDAIFLGGNYLSAADLGVLAAYVAGGGGVYIAAGTGVGGAAAEAAAWNGFLSAFGVQLATNYNGVQGALAVSGDAIFNGVTSLYFNSGNSLAGTSVVCCSASGLFAVFRTSAPPEIPLPAAGWLMITALAGLFGLHRRA